MTHVQADRVKDTTTTTGTGNVTLSGSAPSGFQAFGAVMANNDTCFYVIEGGAEWEVGIGTYVSATPALARTTVLASSNSGSAVSFSAGTKNVFLDLPASLFPAQMDLIFPNPPSGQWYTFAPPGPVYPENSPGANSMQATPVLIPRGAVINSLGIFVSHGISSSNAGAALYPNGANKPTGTPLAKTGNLATATDSTFVSATLTGGNVTFARPTWAWFVCWASSGLVNIQGLRGDYNSWLGPFFGSQSISNLINSASAGYACGGMYNTSHSFNTGSWPDVTSDSWSMDPGGFENAIVGYWKAA